MFNALSETATVTRSSRLQSSAPPRPRHWGSTTPHPIPTSTLLIQRFLTAATASNRPGFSISTCLETATTTTRTASPSAVSLSLPFILPPDRSNSLQQRWGRAISQRNSHSLLRNLLKLAADPKMDIPRPKNARNVTHSVRHAGRSGDVPRTRVCVTRTRGACHTDDPSVKPWGRSSLPRSPACRPGH